MDNMKRTQLLSIRHRVKVKTLFLIVSITTIYLLLSIFLSTQTTPVHAFGLKVSPLKYEEQLKLGAEKTGYVDVSNPGDFNVTVGTEVQAFRQINTDGDLEFYDDEQTQKGVEVDVDEFQLAPREAARIYFAIDSNQLPEGGVYAAILFSTEENQADKLETSAIGTTSRVGTLLILENGDKGVKKGGIRNINLPFWQFGKGIKGDVDFAAADQEKSIAFEPGLRSSLPIAGERDMEGGLVFPGNTRRFELDRTGGYFGVFPVEVTDEVTGDSERTWVFALTGIWQIIIPFIVLILVIGIFVGRYGKKSRSGLRKNRKK